MTEATTGLLISDYPVQWKFRNCKNSRRSLDAHDSELQQRAMTAGYVAYHTRAGDSVLLKHLSFSACLEIFDFCAEIEERVVQGGPLRVDATGLPIIH